MLSLSLSLRRSGGMSGLTGIGLARSADLMSVVLTDGNPMAVENQRICLKINPTKITQTDCCILVWDRRDTAGHLVEVLAAAGGGKFDIIIGADCLFFSDFHEDLLHVLQVSLAPNGVVWLLQPPRGGTMEKFTSMAEKVFVIERRGNVDNEFGVFSSSATTACDLEDTQKLKLLLLRHKIRS